MDGRCTLETAVGRFGICPGSACPLWAQGEGCALASARHELSERPELAAYLLELRQELTDAESASRSRLARLMNEEEASAG
jgi:hypothetical protein